MRFQGENDESLLNDGDSMTAIAGSSENPHGQKQTFQTAVTQQCGRVVARFRTSTRVPTHR